MGKLPYQFKKLQNHSKKVIFTVTVLLILSVFLYEPYNTHRVLVKRFQDAWIQEDSDFESRMAGPIPPDDPDLLKYVRERYLIPPSTNPYFMEEETKHGQKLEYLSYRKTTISWVYLDKLITTLFQDEPPGFFVEAGAFDGEYLSNTLELERKASWKGLLVEVDPQLFSRLQEKHRKAWSSNTCLATSPYPHKTTLVAFTTRRTSKEEFALVTNTFNALQETPDLEYRMAVAGHPVYKTVQCLPLQTLLLALNVTRVDFVSLDVEGVEMGILRSFFKSNVTVDVWIVEHGTTGRPRVDWDFIYWFQSKGYTLYTHGHYYPTDYTFIRNSSDIYKRAFASRPKEYRAYESTVYE